MPSERAVVVIGASAGGVEALRHVLSKLPGDLNAAVVVVVHIPTAPESQLARILDRSSALSVSTARVGDQLTPGCVLVAPQDHHVLVQGANVVLSRGPRINGH